MSKDSEMQLAVPVGSIDHYIRAAYSVPMLSVSDERALAVRSPALMIYRVAAKQSPNNMRLLRARSRYAAKSKSAATRPSALARVPAHGTGNDILLFTAQFHTD